MPTYTYSCQSCAHRFDAVQSIADASLTACPQCDGALRKVYGSVGVAFKGSGFYRTDSRKSGTSSTPAATPATAAAKGASGSSGSSGASGSGGATSSGGSKSSTGSKPAAT